MSNLLDGSSDHHHYAPLSTGQTIAISRHLQDQIKQVQILIEEQQRELGETHEGLAALKEKVEGNTHGLHELSAGLSGNKAMCDSNRKWLSRVSSTLTKMQTGLDHADEGIGALKDAEQVNANSLKKISDDLNTTTELANRLHAGERRAEISIRTLQDEIAKVNLQLTQQRNDDESLKQSMQESWEAVRENAATSKNLMDNLDETNTLVKIIERRLAEAGQNARIMKQDLEETNGGLLKTHEDHENSKAHIAELQSGMRRVTVHAKSIQETLEKVSQKLEVTAGKVGDNGRSGEGIQQAMDELSSTVQGLQQGHQRSAQNMQHLQRELANVSSTTMAVKAGLKEQSSLLLPNIGMDSMEAQDAIARHGTMLGGARR